MAARVRGAPSYYTDKAYKKIRIDRDVANFSELAQRIIADNRTFLNFDRLYTLWQGVRDMPADALAVEVGVYRGGSARFLAEAMNLLGKTGELYACDTFAGHASVDSRVDGEHRVHEGFADVRLDEVRAYLSDQNVRLIVGDIALHADEIPDGPIGLLHVDVDVYPATRFCLEHFGPRSDMIVVDDYGFITTAGAKQAVDEFVGSDWRMFHLLTGQALLVRVSPRNTAGR